MVWESRYYLFHVNSEFDVKFYRCKKDEKVLANVLSETITIEHIRWVMKNLSAEFQKGGKFTTVNILEEGVIFRNSYMISTLSNFVTDHSKSYKESIYIGLSGFHKVLLKMHIMLMKSDMSRLVLENVDELKEKRDISFPEDFELVSEYSADN